jgi:cell wall-associated NlpC family hydrolase
MEALIEEVQQPATASGLVAAALSWVGTPFEHQGRIKGVGVDCVNYVGEVAREARATPDIAFETNYRRRANGTQMLSELFKYLEHAGENLEDAKTGDILALHDGFDPDIPRHLAFVTRLTPYPRMAHASQHGVKCHRIDAHFRSRIHSVWRVPGLIYE